MWLIVLLRATFYYTEQSLFKVLTMFNSLSVTVCSLVWLDSCSERYVVALVTIYDGIWYQVFSSPATSICIQKRCYFVFEKIR